jgi:hypothetical protein
MLMNVEEELPLRFPHVEEVIQTKVGAISRIAMANNAILKFPINHLMAA